MAKILLVDDDKVLSKYTKVFLTGENHTVEVAHAGAMAWDMLQSDQFDLVILDWDLPDIKGIDILKRFRAAGGSTPVLMLTGRTSVSNKEMGLDSGADDYLTKPFHIKELGARIRATLRKSESQTQALKPLGENNEAVLKKGNLFGTALAARYEFLDVLGEGGIGIVFKARHPHLHKFMAIKMLQAQELNAESIARFEIEAQAASRLDHPNIATIHDFGVTERRQPFMVMEFIEGSGLDQVLARDLTLKIEPMLDIFVQVCDAMAHAHAMDVLHRDIKPSNIMLKQVPGRATVAKVLDFGCAKLRDLKTQKAIDLTQAGQVFGSPPYMSPEQARGRQLDERSDIYSLGCVIYEAITGTPPHIGENVMEILFKHVEEPVLPLREARPDLDIPPELEPIVAKVLAREPDKRYQSMLDLKAELQTLQARARLG